MSSQPTFVELFGKYPTDKDTDHSYGPVYDDLFAPLRASVRSVLELGIDRGGSLKAWRDYFPCAKVYGVDSEEKSLFADERITTIRADLLYHGPLMRALCEHLGPHSVDVIVDDGPHNLIQQLGCLYVLWYLLRPGGLYIIEDAIQMYEYLFDLLDGLSLWNLTGVTTQVIDRREVKGRSDDILIIFRKP